MVVQNERHHGASSLFSSLATLLLCFPLTLSLFENTAVSGQRILETVQTYQQLREDAANSNRLTRRQNVDVLDFEESPWQNKHPRIGICHLPSLIPFTDIIEEVATSGNDNGDDTPKVAVRRARKGTLEGAATILLAIQHFNAGNGTVIPQLEGINETCPIRFTTEFFDTEHSRIKAIDDTIQLVERESSPLREQAPCAFLGAYRSSITVPTSMITGVKGYPQFSPISTSVKLEDNKLHPLFGRLVPSDDGTAIGAIQYFSRINVRNFAVLHTDDAYGAAYAASLKAAASNPENDMTIVTVEISADITKVTNMDLQWIVAQLKETQFTYFFGVIYGSTHYSPVMEEAFRQGIAGTGKHNWMFADAVSGIDDRSYARHSALYNATRGIGLITPVGGRESPLYKRFSQALRELSNEEDLQYVASLLPTYDDHNSSSSAWDPLAQFDSYLDESTPGLIEPFFYDTVVTFGLAACQILNGDSVSFAGEQFFQQILKTSLEGVSGNIVLDPLTGTRDPTSALFAWNNFVEDEKSDQASGTIVKFKSVVTDYYENEEWTSINPYYFNDGSTNPPRDLPPPEEDLNLIPIGLRVCCMGMGVLVIVLSIGFAIWTQRHRKDQVIRSSQPIFLHIICVGTALMGAAIVPNGIDEGVVETTRGLDIACQLPPWLLLNGFAIAFCALFTKTRRVNKLLNSPTFKRVTITPFDVMKPMFGFLGGTYTHALKSPQLSYF